uniref:Uncharacterized protein n=1 Tax=Corethron hystrix TaxID=216773 RepID=A0A6U5GE36_9STRA|mmetsp:Transcript_26350/g.60714  ORF Transcript_26350/g.60714 Transcript_26350/m.60714 type:complete len:602 (+) Transcript_26350:247-2052(+)
MEKSSRYITCYPAKLPKDISNFDLQRNSGDRLKSLNGYYHNPLTESQRKRLSLKRGKLNKSGGQRGLLSLLGQNLRKTFKRKEKNTGKHNKVEHPIVEQVKKELQTNSSERLSKEIQRDIKDELKFYRNDISLNSTTSAYSSESICSSFASSSDLSSNRRKHFKRSRGSKALFRKPRKNLYEIDNPFQAPLLATYDESHDWISALNACGGGIPVSPCEKYTEKDQVVAQNSLPLQLNSCESESDDINHVIKSLEKNIANVNLKAILGSNLDLIPPDLPYDEQSCGFIRRKDHQHQTKKHNPVSCLVGESYHKTKLLASSATNNLHQRTTHDNSSAFINNQGHLSGILGVTKSNQSLSGSFEQKYFHSNDQQSIESLEKQELKKIPEESEGGTGYTSLRDQLAGDNMVKYREKVSLQKIASKRRLKQIRDNRETAKKKLQNEYRDSGSSDRGDSQYNDILGTSCQQFFVFQDMIEKCCYDSNLQEWMAKEILSGNIFYDPRGLQSVSRKTVAINKDSKEDNKLHNLKIFHENSLNLKQSKLPLQFKEKISSLNFKEAMSFETSLSNIKENKKKVFPNAERDDNGSTSSHERLLRIRSKRRLK